MACLAGEVVCNTKAFSVAAKEADAAEAIGGNGFGAGRN
jgi:hypothetical protein